MSIQIKIIQNEIHAETLFGVKSFQDCIAIYKQHRCRFQPATKTWIIPLPAFEDVIQDLENIEQLYIPDSVYDTIDTLRRPPPERRYIRQQFSVADLKVPPIAGKSPYELYQLEDITQVVNNTRFALFNSQGTGKSYESLSGLEILRQKGLVQKVVIVTSPSGVLNIQKEISRFTNFDPTRVTIGNKNNRRPFDLDVDIIICNYRSFLLISDEYQKDRDKGKKKTKDYRSTPIPVATWLNGAIGAIVLDESHFIASPTARQTKTIHLIKSFFDRRYILTGTPYDKEEKLYSQLNFLDSSLVKGYSYSDWLSEYANIGNQFSAYAINYFKPAKLEELQNVVKSISVRRLASDVLNLPENLIKVISVPFESAHKQLYQDMTVWNLLQIDKAKQQLDMRTIVNNFGKFILAVDNPALLDKHITDDMPPKLVKAIQKWKFAEQHSKIDILLDLLDKHKDSKIIIWTAHPSVGFALAELLEKKFPIVINGETKPPRGMLLDEFKFSTVHTFLSSKTQHILIAGIQSLNTAITAVQANVQIYFDISFNFTEYDQSLYRIHRIGQEKTVYTYPLIIDESLDVIRYQAMMDKDFVNKSFLTKEYLDRKTAEALFAATL